MFSGWGVRRNGNQLLCRSWNRHRCCTAN